MSSEETTTERKPGGILPLVGVAVATLVLGGGVGAFVVGPMLAGGAAEGTTVSAAEHGGEVAAASGGHGGEAVSEDYSIENLVVNPAGTQGARFLIVTLTLVPDDGATRDQLVARDAEIRDRLLQVLAAKTVGELSDPSQREQIKEEILAAVAAVVKPGKIRRIFLPQFVLQ